MPWVAQVILAQAAQQASVDPLTGLVAVGGSAGGGVILVAIVKYAFDYLAKKTEREDENGAKATTRAQIRQLTDDVRDHREAMLRMTAIQEGLLKELDEMRREGREAHGRIENGLADLLRMGRDR